MTEALVRLERDFAAAPQLHTIPLDAGSAGSATIDALIARGAASPDPTNASRALVHRDALFQLPEGWLPKFREPFVERLTLTQGRRHPTRPAKEVGVVYRRHIPWLDATLTLRAFDQDRDLAAFSRWMNDAVVAEFWQEQGDLARHRAYVNAVAADPHVQGLVLELGGRSIGYVEAYWAKEDRLAPFYDAANFDRGWHVLIGEADCRGRDFLTAWMPSVSHYLFLADPRTERIVIEPRSDNHKMLKSLARCGYALVKEFDFPHKRAMLGMLWRERFFGEALWIPHISTTSSTTNSAGDTR